MVRPRTADIPTGRGLVESSAVWELIRLRVRPKAPALTETALKLAQTIDRTAAARDLAALTREFRTVMTELTRIATEGPQEVSAVDDLAARRAERLAEVAADAAAGRSVPADR